jgi:hypothetical protein
MRALLLLTSALALAACNKGRGHDGRDGDEITLSGKNGARAFQVGGFEKIALRGPHDVVVTVGGAPSVRAEGDTALLERMEIKVEGGELVIGSKHRNSWSWGGSHDQPKIVVHVTVPALAAASIEGSGDIKIDKVEGERFGGAIGGSGDLSIGSVRVRNADFSIAGSGGISAKGSADSTDISIAGSGDVDAGELLAKTAKVSVMGSGDVRANASESANVSVMGSGDVTMSGTAKCTVSKMGSGDVRCPAS